MNHSSTIGTGIAPSTNNRNCFSLLHDDDDDNVEKEQQFPVEPTSLVDNDIDNAYANNFSSSNTTSSNNTGIDFYDTIQQRATNWIMELEDIRDRIIWCHVENSFHRDRLIMIGITTSSSSSLPFSHDSIVTLQF
jgi:hypothetical protein